MSEKKTFENWLEKFKDDIKKGYSTVTMAHAICGYVHDNLDKEPTILMRLDGPVVASFGEQPFVVNQFKMRNVKAVNAGGTVDLGRWSDNPDGYGMDLFMYEIGRDVAIREYSIITDGMTKCVGKAINSKTKGQLSKDDIVNAQSQAKQYADSVIMNIQPMSDFLIKGQIFEPSRIPESFVPKERRGHYYSGMIGAVNVYWTNSFKDYALVFDREAMIFESTRLQIQFDDLKNPKQLILYKMCVAAPLYDQAVVKIELV